MRIAISGSHGVGKSTLMGNFLSERPGYVEEPEAFEVLAEAITLIPSEGPDLEGLEALLDHTVSVVQGHPPAGSVVFERSPVDYLAYARASELLDALEREEFVSRSLPAVRQAVQCLDLIVLLPVAGSPIEVRRGEDAGFRERVDEVLHGLLIDDEEDLFRNQDAPRVVELSPSPDRQLRWLLEFTSSL